MGQDDERIVLALVRALKEDDNPSIRWNAAWSLGNLGNRNQKAVAALTEALKDKDPALRDEATNVLLHLQRVIMRGSTGTGAATNMNSGGAGGSAQQVTPSQPMPGGTNSGGVGN
jgi:hypothetical protein